MPSFNTLISEPVVAPILGMHRSGTSMVTRALNLLGLELGGPLLPPQADNPKGFWENEFFWAVNVHILKVLGRHPSGYGRDESLRDLPEISRLLTVEETDVQTIGSYVERNFGNCRTWGWKDPRSVLLFPFWLGMLVELGVRDIRPTIISRHPTSCMSSLLKRGDVAPLAHQLSVEPAALALDIWKSYTRVLVAIARETDCYVSHHEWFLDEDLARDELERVAAYLQMGPIDTAPALEWLDPTATHHFSSSPPSIHRPGRGRRRSPGTSPSTRRYSQHPATRLGGARILPSHAEFIPQGNPALRRVALAAVPAHTNHHIVE